MSLCNQEDNLTMKEGMQTTVKIKFSENICTMNQKYCYITI